MAENKDKNFQNVVKALGKATKKPSAGKAPIVLGVQLVDKTGKVDVAEKIIAGGGTTSGKGAPGVPPGVPAPGGASAAEAGREEKATQTKQTILFEQMANSMAGSWASLKALNKSFLESVKEKGKMGLGIIIAVIAAPIIALVSFFKQLALEFKFLSKLTGKGLTKLFAPLKNLLTGKGPIGKAFTSLSKTLKTISSTIKGSKAFKAIGTVGKTVKSVITSLGKFFTPMIRFFKTVFNLGKTLTGFGGAARGIMGFAKTFGTVLGKIFLPITILMSAFDFITGFMKGYEEGGILGGLKEGLSKLFKNLIGMPLDLLKSAVSWILGVFGWDSAEKWLDSFSFSDLIGTMIGGIFDMIKAAWEWIKKLFTDPVGTLKQLWNAYVGVWTNIGGWLWNTLMKPAWDWIKGIFGFKSADAEDADSKKGVLGFLKGLVEGIWNWFKGLFDFSTVGKAFASVLNIIFLPHTILLGLVTGIWNWFKGLFGFDTTDTTSADKQTKPGGIGGMLLGLITGVWKWFKGLFGWGTDKEPVEDADGKKGVLGFLKGLVEGIWTWFKNLFDFSTVGKAFASVLNIIFLPHTILLGLVTGIWNWFKGLFGFDTTDTTDAAKQTKPGGIGGMLLSLVSGVWTWFKGLFGWGTTPSKEPAKDADSTKGILGFLGDIMSGVWTWFKGLFGWGTDKEPVEDADGKKGVLGFLKGLVEGIWNWFKGLFDFSTVGKAFASVLNIIFLPHTILLGLVTGIWNWFKGLFGFDTTDTTDADKQTKPGGIGGIILDLITGVWNWFKGLFAWGKKKGETAAGGFSLWTMITGVIESIGDFFWNKKGTGILQLDFSKIKDIIPDWMKDPAAAVGKLIKSLTKFLPSWLGGPDKSEADMKKEAEKLADETKKKNEEELKRRADRQARREKAMEKIREKLAQQQLWLDTKGEKGKEFQMGRASGTDKGDIQDQKELMADDNRMLARLVAQSEKAKALDIEFKKKATTKSPNSSIFTHDQGLHDRLDRIFPLTDSGRRAAAMLQAGIQRDMGGGGAGGGITSINTGGNVVSSPTTNYVNNGIAARRPIILAA